MWKQSTFTISYNANGGNGAPSSQTKTYGTDITLSATNPTRDGYTFQGWATSSNGSVAYKPGDTYSANSNLNLYAVWGEFRGYFYTRYISYLEVIKLDYNGNKLWAKRIDGASNDDDIHLASTNSGGVLVAFNNYIIKLDSSGNQQWKKTIYINAEAIASTNDGGFIVACDTAIGSGIIKYDSNGNEQWRKYISVPADAIAATNDGGFIVASNNTSYLGYAIKYDNNMNEQWSINIGRAITGIDPANECFYTTTNGYTIEKYNSSGNECWSKYIDGIFLDYTDDGGFFAIKLNLSLTKYDSNGNEQWKINVLY